MFKMPRARSALYYYRQQLEVHLGKRFDDGNWQAMVALGYAVDELRRLGFVTFFHQEEQSSNGHAWTKELDGDPFSES